jgi:ectoine hydroxylase-related dioxygenase (phytanoyl-CoA dioxygenase family)
LPFVEDGFEIVDDFVESSYLDRITTEISQSESTIRRGGIRNAEKTFGSVLALLESGILSDAAETYLNKKASFVRAIVFDKTPTNNWLVTWHQDRTIAVSSKLKIEGWGPWSVKDGCHHVQPGIEVLNSMVTFRIHLDESNEESGCLRVIPGSHRFGVMSQDEIFDYVKTAKPKQCIANVNSAMVMRPHILHASSKATKPSSRRVLHVEFSSYSLPNGLKWA